MQLYADIIILQLYYYCMVIFVSVLLKTACFILLIDIYYFYCVIIKVNKVLRDKSVVYACDINTICS